MVEQKKTTPTSRTNPTVEELQTSGAVSGTTFDTWFTHTQTINGSWVRKWVYDSHPVASTAGTASACPTVAYSYIEVTFGQMVNQRVESASYSASSNAATHNIEYTSDSVSGGWGTSGLFWTAQTGLIRNARLVTDVETQCDGAGIARTNQIPGVYDVILDTSSNFNSEFVTGVVAQAIANCPQFNPVLVTI